MSPPRRPFAASSVLASLFLALWILPPFWRIATLEAVNVQDDVYASDLWNDRLPVRAWIGESWARGELPLWCPDLYTGFPLLAAVEAGALYPTNALLFAALDPYAAIAWAQLLPLFLAGLGTFLLAREYALPPAAAWLAAGAFSLSGFLVGHLRQLNMVDAAAWIPLLLFLAERVLRTGSRAARVGFALACAMQWLAGHPQVSYLTALVGAPFVIVRWRQLDRLDTAGERGPWPLRLAASRRLRALVLAGLVGTALAGAQLVPATELARMSHRSGGFTFEDAAAYPASPRSLLTFVRPHAMGNIADDTFAGSGIFWEQYLYLGLLPALLALVAVALGWRSPIVRLLGATALGSSLLALGPGTPLFGLAWSVVPGMALFRFPTRFFVFAELAVALLAGIGLARLLALVFRPRLRSLAAAIVLATTAADLWVHQMEQVPQAPRERWTAPIPTAEALREAGGRLEEPWRYFSLDPTLVHAVAFHEARGWAGGTEPFERLRLHLQPSFNLLHGLATPDGYVNLAPRPYEAVWGSDKEPGLVRPSGEAGASGWALRPAVGRLLRLFNVHWIVSAWPARSAALGNPVAVFPEGFGIQPVIDPLPRAFVVGRTIAAASEAAALAWLESADFDPAREAVVHEEIELPADAAPSRRVRVVRPSARSLRVTTSLERPGLLVVSEGRYPGWKARLDGREVPIHRANVMMRAVVVPAGEHEVTFTYEPGSLLAGVLVSALGLAALALLARARS